MYGNDVRSIISMEDGRLAVVTYDTNGVELVCLAKTDISEIPEKEIITIGSLYADFSLQQMAVDFNKRNRNYKIVIKTYGDIYNISKAEDADAVTAMNMDIISGNGRM